MQSKELYILYKLTYTVEMNSKLMIGVRILESQPVQIRFISQHVFKN